MAGTSQLEGAGELHGGARVAGVSFGRLAGVILFADVAGLAGIALVADVAGLAGVALVFGVVELVGSRTLVAGAFSRKAGFSLSTETTVSLPPLRILKILSDLSKTGKGPSYGGCRGGFTAS